MCTTIAKEIKKWKLQESPTLMYYLIQVTASILLLARVRIEASALTGPVIILTLITKIGAWPLHLWYIKLIRIIEIKYKRITIVITWQKILPVILISSMIEKEIYSTLIIRVLCITIIVPLSRLTSKLSIKRVMALSSFNNNGWLLAAALTSLSTFWTFLILYRSTLLVTLKALNMIKNKRTAINLPFWASLLVVSNIGGLPPITIFWAKILVVKTIILEAPTELAIVLIITACYLLYHYLWIVLNEISLIPTKTQLTKSTERIIKPLIITVFSTRTLGAALTLFLGLT